jgi:transposase
VRWIKEDGLEQKLIVTYSVKYKNYQRKLRETQVERAVKTMSSQPGKLTKVNQNDYRRFIVRTHSTPSGEIAGQEHYSINTDLIEKEEAYDGYYAVCTNLEDNAVEIIKVNRRRWEIEECFRIMKSEFKARPVYLSRDDRIKAHFTTCFISLIIYRILEKRLGNKYTCHELISALREMNFLAVKAEGYIPTYTRTDLTDDLHDVFGFRTDYQIVNIRQVKKILRGTKK